MLLSCLVENPQETEPNASAHHFEEAAQLVSQGDLERADSQGRIASAGCLDLELIPLWGKKVAQKNAQGSHRPFPVAFGQPELGST